MKKDQNEKLYRKKVYEIYSNSTAPKDIRFYLKTKAAETYGISKVKSKGNFIFDIEEED